MIELLIIGGIIFLLFKGKGAKHPAGIVSAPTEKTEVLAGNETVEVTVSPGIVGPRPTLPPKPVVTIETQTAKDLLAGSETVETSTYKEKITTKDLLQDQIVRTSFIRDRDTEKDFGTFSWGGWGFDWGIK